MSAYYAHARAIADALRAVPNVEVVPYPPQTPMMHLHLRVDEHTFLQAARRIAHEQSVFTWPGTSATDTPSVRSVELTVGDATLEFAPDKVARIVRQLVS